MLFTTLRYILHATTCLLHQPLKAMATQLKIPQIRMHTSKCKHFLEALAGFGPGLPDLFKSVQCFFGKLIILRIKQHSWHLQHLSFDCHLKVVPQDPTLLLSRNSVCCDQLVKHRKNPLKGLSMVETPMQWKWCSEHSPYSPCGSALAREINSGRLKKCVRQPEDQVLHRLAIQKHLGPLQDSKNLQDPVALPVPQCLCVTLRNVGSPSRLKNIKD